jgi:hypothetical protein
MALTLAAPPGTDITDALLNALAPLAARYEQKSSAQSISSSTDTKLKFETAVHTNTDVVASGTGNTDFALQRAGFWLVTTGIRYLGNAGGGERHIFPQTGSAFAVANRIGGVTAVNVGSAPCTISTATVFKIAAVTTVIIGAWQNCGAALSVDTGFGGANHVSFTWLGPA